jgi:uncharacterized protein YndB with AHSA1/START domain
MKLKFTFELDASVENVWRAIANWPSQGEWMLATRVDLVEDHEGVGTKIAAFTGAVPSRGWFGIWE